MNYWENRIGSGRDPDPNQDQLLRWRINHTCECCHRVKARDCDFAQNIHGVVCWRCYRIVARMVILSRGKYPVSPVEASTDHEAPELFRGGQGRTAEDIDCDGTLLGIAVVILAVACGMGALAYYLF